MGDENSKASVYYAYLEGGQKIYTISEELPEAGGYGLYDMIDAVSFPGITVSNINQVKMTLSDGRWMLLTREMKEEKSTEEGDESAAAAEQETVWVYTDSQDRRVETETASSVSWLQTVASIEYGSCTDYKVEGEALKEYGFCLLYTSFSDLALGTYNFSKLHSLWMRYICILSYYSAQALFVLGLWMM